MKTETLRGLIEIVHENSIRKAAQNLAVPQQTLNKNITSLENDLGVKVLERTNHGVQLTDAGIEVYQFAKWCLSEHQAMLNVLQPTNYTQPKTTNKDQIIKLGCVSTAIQNVVSKAMAEAYRFQYTFDLQVEKSASKLIIEKVMREEYQFGIILQYQSDNLQYPAFDKSLQFIPLYYSRPYAWVSKKSYLARYKRLTLEELEAHTIIRLQEADNELSDFIFSYNQLKNRKIITCENIYYAAHMANMNLGIILDMKTGNKLNLEQNMNEIAIALPMKLTEDYKLVTGILVKKGLMNTELYDVIELILRQR